MNSDLTLPISGFCQKQLHKEELFQHPMRTNREAVLLQIYSYFNKSFSSDPLLTARARTQKVISRERQFSDLAIIHPAESKYVHLTEEDYSLMIYTGFYKWCEENTIAWAWYKTKPIKRYYNLLQHEVHALFAPEWLLTHSNGNVRRYASERLAQRNAMKQQFNNHDEFAKWREQHKKQQRSVLINAPNEYPCVLVWTVEDKQFVDGTWVYRGDFFSLKVIQETV